MTNLSAGIFQFNIRTGDVNGNTEAASHGIRQLAAQGAGLVLLPELFPCGFDYERLSGHAARAPEILSSLSGMARREGIVIAGSLPEEDSGGIYNSLYILDADGTIAGKYRKIHLFPLTGEDRHFRAGGEAVVCSTSLGPVGLMICFDLRFPELCRALALKGATIVLVSAQWPARRIDHWDALLRARAIENQIFLLGANRYGSEGKVFFNGHSQIISPEGCVLSMTAAADSFISAPLNPEAVQSSRGRFNCLQNRAPDAYAIRTE
ncbi:MAG: nitrilase-related carbon-nitrogen hydrolase [Desulfosalsimonadaceae bacterium]